MPPTSHTIPLEVIEKLYKRNELASGHFMARGQRIDLVSLRTPLILLAARDDELPPRASWLT